MRASIFLVLLLAGAAFHCGGSDSTGLATDGGTSGDGATNNPPGCPSAPPAVGTACTVEKLQCAYGTCSVTQRTCTNGTWVDSSRGGAPGPGACPDTVPNDGTPCDACSLPSSCSYPCTGGASSPTEATCKGTWQVRQGLGPCSGAGECSPPCAADLICCSEPTHRTDDAGKPGALWTCVQPSSGGACPAFP